MKANIVILPGDGIGTEVTAAAVRVLKQIEETYLHDFDIQEHLIGGVAIIETGDPLPQATLQACLQSDGILLGAVGHPRWNDPGLSVRPEQGLLHLRQALGVYCNLRPIQVFPALYHASPVKASVLENVDLMIVRELTGGLYFGKPRFREHLEDGLRAVDTMEYTQGEIERIARLAFQFADRRNKKVTSVDKANVLETSRLWRQVVSDVAKDYPAVYLEHMLVDSAAMWIISNPRRFDVILTENLFGDILSDEASVLAGSLGLLPSASIGSGKGLFEPVHGSAPDIAGQGIANPIGAILSAAMLLRYGLQLEREAQAVEHAVNQAVSSKAITIDLGGNATTAQITEKILGCLNGGE